MYLATTKRCSIFKGAKLPWSHFKYIFVYYPIKYYFNRFVRMADKPSPKNVNVWAGAETGLLKSVDLVKKEATNHYVHFGKEHEVLSMCWDDIDNNVLYTGHLNGKIRKYSHDKSSFVDCYDIPDYDSKKEKLVSLYKNGDKFMTCTNDGALKIWNPKELPNDVRTLVVGSNLQCTAYNAKDNLFASGGLENCLKIWDLNVERKVVFRAKNVKPDWLQLRIPINVMQTAFLPESDKILTTTGTHNIRIYDPKSNFKKPVLQISFEDHPILAASVCERNPPYFFVGNTRGFAARFDVRQLKWPVRCYRGFAGSIRSIVPHPTEPYVFSCGLDRHLLVHDETVIKPKYKVYLKSRLNCLLASKASVEHEEIKTMTDGKENLKRKNSEASEDEDDEMWNKMKKISDSESEYDDDDDEDDY